MNSNQLIDVGTNVRRVDGPNYNELERMEEITARVNRAIDFSRRLKLDKAQLDFEVAEELLQMLNDGLRTAKQLQDRAKPDWRIGITVKPKYRNHIFFGMPGKVVAVFPSGWGGLQDDNGILQIELAGLFEGMGRMILARSDEWVTA